jgi:hypothetical protein
MLSAGTTPKDSNLNDAYIKAEIVQVTNQKLKIEHYANMKEGGRDVLPQCIATYSSVAVVNDTTFKRNYSVLPAYPMNLPNGVGIQQVRPQTGVPARDTAMIPIMPHEMELFKSLLVGSEILKDQWTFEPDRNKVWYSRKNNKTLLEDGISAVEIKMVVYDPSAIAEDDNYPIPPEMEIEIITGVLMLHGFTTKEILDSINNDNANQ